MIRIFAEAFNLGNIFLKSKRFEIKTSEWKQLKKAWFLQQFNMLC